MAPCTSNILEFLPKTSELSDKSSFILEPPDVVQYYYLTSCLNLIPNRQFMVQSKIIDFLATENSMVITGHEYSGKSTFIRALNSYKTL